MKLSEKAKKRIAKEFLSFAFVLIISTTGFLIALAYEATIEKNYNDLKRSYESKSLKLEEIYKNDNEIFYPEESQRVLWKKISNQSLYTRSFEQFKVQYSDSSSRHKMHEHMLREGYTDKSLETFFNTYFPHVNQSVLSAPTAGEKEIIDQERKLQNEISQLSTLIEEKQLKLENKRHYRYATNTTIITFIILFPIRYFLMAIKWSIRVLKS